jgi:hypothetical protein
VTKLGKASKEQSALGHIAWPAVVIRVTAFKEKLMFALPPPGVAAEITGFNSSSPPPGSDGSTPIRKNTGSPV